MQKLTDKKDVKELKKKPELPKTIREKLKEEAEKLVTKLENEFELEEADCVRASRNSQDKIDQENSKKSINTLSNSTINK